MIAGLKGLGRGFRYRKTTLCVFRAGFFIAAFAVLGNPGFAFSHSERASFLSQPRLDSALLRQGFYGGSGLFTGQRRLVFYAKGYAYANGRASRQAAPSGSRQQSYGTPRNSEARPAYGGNQRGGSQRPPHLGAWLQRHQNMSPAEQQRALQNEPGFNRLPPETQRQLADRLRQIDSMPPEQRQRTLDRIEAMERLSPQMRQQVRTSMGEMRTLPAGRQRMVKKAFRDLRNYPPEQRENMMASPQFQREFTPQERGILSGLLSVEPYEPNIGFRPEYSPPPGR